MRINEKKLTSILLLEDNSLVLFERADFQTLARITQAMNPSFTLKAVQVLQEFLTLYHSQVDLEKEKNEHSRISLIESKEMAWRVLWNKLSKTPDEKELIEALVNEAAVASRISPRKPFYLSG